MRPTSSWPEVGEDALDPPRPASDTRWLWLPRRRPALGVRSTAAPTVMFVLLGVILGPKGIGILSHAVLGALDVVASVALAVIGVFVGLGISTVTGASGARAVISGMTVAVITTATVTGGLYLLIPIWGMPLPVEVFAFAGILGICASASAAAHVPASAGAALRRAVRLADVDDIAIVLLGAVALAALAGGEVLQRLMMTAIAGAAIGFAGWLLFERAKETAERGVFVTGAVLLLAGIGTYLSTSPLLSGCVAALVWAHAPGPADRITAGDLRTLQHPLVALVLIMAGALIDWDPRVLWVAGAVVLLRLTGKLTASLAVAPLAQVSPALLATVLLPPGIVGIALALNVRQVLGAEAAGIVVGAAASAAVASELIAAFLARAHEDPS